MTNDLSHSSHSSKAMPATITEALLLAMGANYCKVKKGEYIFLESTHCRFYHQLVSGSVRWLNIDDTGKEFIQALVAPGESFGELPLFDDGPYAASAIANENSVIFRLKKETFLQLLHNDPTIHFAIFKKLTERLRFRFLLLKILANPSPAFRIKTLFNFIKVEQKYICPHCHQIKLTRQQIADFVGLRVETVIRAIRRLHEEGVLQVKDRKIFIK